MKSFLILEDGTVFEGQGIGAKKDVVCEMVFNTSMTGYLEILTDPSYAGEGIVMTYPLIGNYGINSEDCESHRPWAEVFIVRELSDRPSNFRSEGKLESFLIEHDIPGIQGIDTRALTKILRVKGTMNGVITTDENYDLNECVKKAKAYSVGEVVSKVSCKEKEEHPNEGFSVAVLDYGCKRNIVRSLVNRNCKVTVYPAWTDAEEILAANHDGIVLSNGPGDPKTCTDIIKNVKKMYDSDIPIFAVCLGHQLMALANGADTQKLKYGHRGANHPVKDVLKDRVYITSQNHGYVVMGETLDPKIGEVTHINVNDGTCEGVRYKNKSVFTVQFHPEASPGPLDTGFLFDEFIQVMEEIKNA